jgi:LacI family transcriptional regulator
MARTAKPGLKDVAAHAGVSIATVSRVINAGPYVTDAVRTKVTASMQALGYEPHALARSLRTGQTHTIGYVIGDISSPLFATIARGIDDTLQSAGFTLFLGNSCGNTQHELHVIKQLLRRRVDGLILALADETDPALRRALADVQTPLVLLDRDVAGLKCDRVLIDHAQGINAAVAHLHALGHTRIALITVAPNIRPGRAISTAFSAALQRHRLPATPGLIAALAPHSPQPTANLAALVQRPDRPTALIAGGATITPAVLRAVHELGVRIPQDLALIAYDDTDVTALHSPPLTVVARDVYAIGAQAARLLLDRLGANAGTGRKTITIPTTLIVRGSTVRKLEEVG